MTTNHFVDDLTVDDAPDNEADDNYTNNDVSVPFPPPYFVNEEDEIVHIKQLANGNERVTLVSHRPIWLSKITVDADTGEQSFTLSWDTGLGIESVVIPRRQALSTGGLLALTSKGFPTDPQKARHLVAMLSAYERAHLASLPRGAAASRLGWHGNAFAVGHEVLGDQALSVMTDPGLDDLVRGFRAQGDPATWQTLARNVAHLPGLVFGIYAAVAPAVLGLLDDVEGFTVEWAGTTSTGKSTAMRLAASVWGSPARIIGSWDTTRVGLEARLATSGNLPVFLDDTAAVSDPRIIEDVVYDITKGRTRARGTSSGSSQRSRRYRTVLISTGEQPITSFGSKGGARARSIVFRDPPLGVVNRAAGELAKDIHFGTLDAHGHLGPAVVELLLKTDAAKLGGVYRKMARDWSSKSTSPVATRIGSHFAVLHLAGKLIEETELALGADPEEVLSDIWDQVAPTFEDVDPSIRALQHLHGWLIKHQSEFYGRGENRTSGWSGAWPAGSAWKSVALLPQTLERALGRKFDLEATIDAWDRKGWLDRDGDRRQKRFTVGADRPRCYAIMRSAFITIGEIRDDEHKASGPRRSSTWSPTKPA
jgi:uncharacterized protein (DUF927 family)